MFARQQVDNPLYIGSAMLVARCSYSHLIAQNVFRFGSIDFLWVFVRDRGLYSSFRQPPLTCDRLGSPCDTILCQVTHGDAVSVSNQRVTEDPGRFKPTRARSDRKWCFVFASTFAVDMPCQVDPLA